MRRVVFVLVVCLMSLAAKPTRKMPAPLYRMTLVQAAPGKLSELIAAYKKQFAALQAIGDEAPLWMRHSQGDHWDLLVLYPMGIRYSDYYGSQHVGERIGFLKVPQELIVWQEDWFCYGPDYHEALADAFAKGGFFHVEMFISLPSNYEDLLHEREMENAYARALHQPENFIFTRDAGAAWDIVTIGVFRDLKHYAASADATPEVQQAAAKAAGFDSPAAIGPYLRRFIRTHHDTLAVSVK
jgi:hypothetical protein